MVPIRFSLAIRSISIVISMLSDPSSTSGMI